MENDELQSAGDNYTNNSRKPKRPSKRPGDSERQDESTDDEDRYRKRRHRRHRRRKNRNCFDYVKTFCTSKVAKFIVTISTFIVGALLIGISGIMAIVFYFVLVGGNSHVFPYIIFNIYCILFGLSFILAGSGIKIITRVLIFLYSYYHRAFFIIFTGTLTFLVFHPFSGYQWIGYFVGSVIMAFGILYLCVGCCDSRWRKDQQKRMKREGRVKDLPRYDKMMEKRGEKKKEGNNFYSPEKEEGEEEEEEEEKEVEEEGKGRKRRRKKRRDNYDQDDGKENRTQSHYSIRQQEQQYPTYDYSNQQSNQQQYYVNQQQQEQQQQQQEEEQYNNNQQSSFPSSLPPPVRPLLPPPLPP